MSDTHVQTLLEAIVEIAGEPAESCSLVRVPLWRHKSDSMEADAEGANFQVAGSASMEAYDRG